MIHVVYAIFDKSNQFICAFAKEPRAVAYCKTLAKCRGCYVKAQEMKDFE